MNATEQEEMMGRVMLSPEELDALMPEGEQVHTFMQDGPCINGADWDRKDLLELAEQNGAELSGEMATLMKHGALVWNRGEALFVETVEERLEARK